MYDRFIRSLPSALVTAGTYLNAFSQWYLVWLFARTSGAELAGQYSALFAYTTPVFAVAHFGLRDHYLTAHTRYPWQSYLRMRAMGILLGVAVTGLLVWILDLPLAMALAVLSLKVANAVLDLYNGRIQYAQDFIALGVISTANALVTIVAATVVAVISGNVIGAVWASTLTSLVCSVAAWKRGRSDAPQAGSEISHVRGISQGAIPITAAQLAAALTVSLPILVVERSGSAADVGVFASAAYLLTFANLTGAAIRLVELPRLGETYQRSGRVALARRTDRLTLVYLALGLAGSGLTIAYGPDLLTAVYGPEFIMDRLAIGVLAVAASLAVPSYMLTAELLVLNKYRSQSVIAVVSLGAALLFAFLAMIWSGMDAILTGALTAVAAKMVQVLLTIAVKRRVARS